MVFMLLEQDEMLPIGRGDKGSDDKGKESCYLKPAGMVPSSPSTSTTITSGTKWANSAACKSPYSRYFDGTPQHVAAAASPDAGSMCFGASPLARWLEGSPIAVPPIAVPTAAPTDSSSLAPMPMMVMVPFASPWGQVPAPAMYAPSLDNAMPLSMVTASATTESHGPPSECAGFASVWPIPVAAPPEGFGGAAVVNDTDASIALPSSSYAEMDASLAATNGASTAWAWAGSNNMKAAAVNGVHGWGRCQTTKQHARSKDKDAAEGPKAIFVDLSKLRPKMTAAVAKPKVVPPKDSVSVSASASASARTMNPLQTVDAGAEAEAERFRDAPWRKPISSQ